MSYKVVELFTNSVGRYDNGEVINEILFSIISKDGLYFLCKGLKSEKDFDPDDIIQACSKVKYEKFFGDINSWLNYELMSLQANIKSVDDRMKELQDEYDESVNLRDDILLLKGDYL